MIKLVESSRYWVLDVVVGNDWSEPTYIETKRFETKEDLISVLQSLDYYCYTENVREVIEYNFE